jgi:hypothetical protein
MMRDNGLRGGRWTAMPSDGWQCGTMDSDEGRWLSCAEIDGNGEQWISMCGDGR